MTNKEIEEKLEKLYSRKKYIKDLLTKKSNILEVEEALIKAKEGAIKSLPKVEKDIQELEEKLEKEKK